MPSSPFTPPGISAASNTRALATGWRTAWRPLLSARMLTHQVSGTRYYTHKSAPSLKIRNHYSCVRRKIPERLVGYTSCRYPYPFVSEALFSSLCSVASRKRWAYSLRVCSSSGKTCVTASNVSRIFTIPSAIISANRAKGSVPSKRRVLGGNQLSEQSDPLAYPVPRQVVHVAL